VSVNELIEMTTSEEITCGGCTRSIVTLLLPTGISVLAVMDRMPVAVILVGHWLALFQVNLTSL